MKNSEIQKVYPAPHQPTKFSMFLEALTLCELKAIAAETFRGRCLLVCVSHVLEDVHPIRHTADHSTGDVEHQELFFFEKSAN